MEDLLEYWCASRRMIEMHEDAARRAVVRSLREPLSLRVAQVLIRWGGWIARRASHRREERLSGALGRGLDVRYERGKPVFAVSLGRPGGRWLGCPEDRR
jgi:hypothetical protein